MKYLLLILFVFFFPRAIQAATVYVDVTIGPASCSNYNPSTRICSGGTDTAYKTLQASVDSGTRSGGDIVLLRSGTSTETGDGTYAVWVYPASGATSTNRLTVRNFLNEQFQLRPAMGGGGAIAIAVDYSAHYVTFSGLNGFTCGVGTGTGTQACGIIVDASDMQVSGCGVPTPCTGGATGFEVFSNDTITEGLEIRNFGYAGWVNGTHLSTPHIVRSNRIHDSLTSALIGGWDIGIYSPGPNIIIENNEIWNIVNNWSLSACPSLGAQGPGEHCSNIIIRNNVLRNSLRGMVLQAIGTNSQVHDNRIYDLYGPGISLREFGQDGGIFYNNTIANINLPAPAFIGNPGWEAFTGDRSCFFVSGSAGAYGIFRNNIAFNCAHSAFYGTTPASTLSNNLGDATISDAGLQIVADPLLVNPSAGDFRLCTGLNQPASNCQTNNASPAIEAGTLTISASNPTVILSAFNGKTRDIGWYETGVAVVSDRVVLQISCDNTVTDTSGEANNGSLQGGATYDSSGKYNQACLFDGVDDYVRVADSSSLDFTTGFTLEAWVKPNTISTAFKSVVTKAASAAPYLYSLNSSSTTTFCANGGPVGGYSLVEDKYACHSIAVEATPTWTHLAVTYDMAATSLKLYRNGVLVNTATANDVLPASSGELRIGGSLVADESFAGLIDEIRLYNYAIPVTSGTNECISAPSITRDMNCPINPVALAGSVGLKVGTQAIKLGVGGGMKLGN